jgi:hypothetical protein
MSNRRDYRRRAGAFPVEKKSRFDKFLSATLKAYSWPMQRMILGQRSIDSLFDDWAGKPPKKREKHELLFDLQVWARRHE